MGSGFKVRRSAIFRQDRDARPAAILLLDPSSGTCRCLKPLLFIAISPRQTGQIVARVRHSPGDETFFDKITSFFASKDISGGPLAIAAIIALVCTNLPFAGAYERFWDTDLAIILGELRVVHPLGDWIDHALLPLLFVIIGADVKREFVLGALSSWRTAMFPLAGAPGGLLVPVAIFLLIVRDPADNVGWGLVVTMDTAFSLAILGIFVSRLACGLCCSPLPPLTTLAALRSLPWLTRMQSISWGLL